MPDLGRSPHLLCHGSDFTHHYPSPHRFRRVSWGHIPHLYPANLGSSPQRRPNTCTSRSMLLLSLSLSPSSMAVCKG